MLLSSSFAVAEEWQVVILPCSHDKDGNLQFLLEKDGDKFKSITNNIKVKVAEGEELSKEDNKNLRDKVNNILDSIGFTENNRAGTWILQDGTRLIYPPIVNPAVILKNTEKYQWIKANEAINKTTNTTDENLKEVIRSSGWKVDEEQEKSFIDTATNLADKRYWNLGFYLEKKNNQWNILLVKGKVKDKSKLYPIWSDKTSFAALQEKDDSAIFSSAVFPTTYKGGQFWQAAFIDASKRPDPDENWVKIEQNIFKNTVTEDQNVSVDQTQYTIPKELFNTIVDYLPKAIEAAEKLEKEKKETGEKEPEKLDTTKDLTTKLAQSLAKLAKA